MTLHYIYQHSYTAKNVLIYIFDIICLIFILNSCYINFKKWKKKLFKIFYYFN